MMQKRILFTTLLVRNLGIQNHTAQVLKDIRLLVTNNSTHTTMYYQNLINQIDSTVNAKACEGFMRCEHDTLDHLSRKQFESAVAEFKLLEVSEQLMYEQFA